MEGKYRGINTFDGGIDKDTHPENQKNNTYRHLENFRLISKNGNNSILSNIKGVKLESTLSEGFVPIGSGVWNNIAYILSHNTTTGVGEIGCFPSPVYDPLPLPNEEKKGLILENTYKPLYNFESGGVRDPFRSVLFNFKLDKPLSVEIKEEADRSVNIYFTDRLNPVRVINSGFKFEEDSTYTLKEEVYSENNFEDTINLNQNTDEVLFVDLDSQTSGGSLESGMYFYHFRYVSSTGDKTPIVATSNPVVVYNLKGNTIMKSMISSEFGDTNEANSVTTDDAFFETDTQTNLALSHVDTSYDSIEVIVEHRYGHKYANKTIYSLDEFEITGDSMIINHNGVEPKDFLVAESELKEIYSTFYIANDLKQLDGRLLACNSKDPIGSDEFNYLKNYASRIKLNYNLEVFTSDQEEFKTYIEDDGDNPRGIYTNFSQIMDDSNGGYRDATNVYYHLGYWPGESYQFGLQYKFKNGYVSPIFLPEGVDLFDINDLDPPTNNNGVLRFPSRAFISHLENASNEQRSVKVTFEFPDLDEFDGVDINTLDADDQLKKLSNEFIKENILAVRGARCDRKEDAIAQSYLIPTFSYPFARWGRAGVYDIFEVFNDAYNYNTSTWDQVVTRTDYINDEENLISVAPMPLGYIDGMNKFANRDGYAAMMSKHLRDPYRYGLYGSDITLNFNEISSRYNGKPMSFEIVGIARLQMSDLLQVLYGDSGAPPAYAMYKDSHNSLPVSPCMIKTYDIIKLSSNEISANRTIKGKVYRVYANQFTRNNRFASLIRAERYEGGIKVSGAPQEWIHPVENAFNEYMGFHVDQEQDWGDIDYFNNTEISVLEGDANEIGSSYHLASQDAMPIKSDIDQRSQLYLLRKDDGMGGETDEVEYTGTGACYIVNIYKGDQGHFQGDIASLYTQSNKRKFYPISQWMSVDNTNEHSIDDFFLDGTREVPFAVGDNFQGIFYRKISWGNYKVEEEESKPYANSGILLQMFIDSNNNPYSRTRDLVNVNEGDKIPEGNMRSYFPVYTDNINDQTNGRQYNTSLNQGEDGNAPINDNLYQYSKKYFVEESDTKDYGGSITTGSVSNVNLDDVRIIQNEFPVRVWYSPKQIAGSPIDSYRLFEQLAHVDFDGQYGAAITLKTIGKTLYLIQERAISRLSFNERKMTSIDGDVQLTSDVVLSDFQQVITSDMGSKHRDSVIATDNSIYGYDANRNKIWKLSSNGLEVISDYKIESFLREISDYYTSKVNTIGSYYVHTFRDYKNAEILFSFKSTEDLDKTFTLSYNEALGTFSHYNGFYPDRGFGYSTSLFTIHEGNIYTHEGVEARNIIYGEQKEAFVEVVLNPKRNQQNVYDNIIINSNKVFPSKIEYIVVNEEGNEITTTVNYDVDGQPVGLNNHEPFGMKYQEGWVMFAIPFVGQDTTPNSRVSPKRHRGKEMRVRIYYNHSTKVEINEIGHIYRVSYVK